MGLEAARIIRAWSGYFWLIDRIIDAGRHSII